MLLVLLEGLKINKYYIFMMLSLCIISFFFSFWKIYFHLRRVRQGSPSLASAGPWEQPPDPEGESRRVSYTLGLGAVQHVFFFLDY